MEPPTIEIGHKIIDNLIILINRADPQKVVLLDLVETFETHSALVLYKHDFPEIHAVVFTLIFAWQTNPFKRELYIYSRDQKPGKCESHQYES